MIIRVRRPKQYTSIPTKTLQDSRLTLAQLGLLVRLLSRPDGWEIRSATLRKECGVGRDALRGLLRGLEDTGYLLRDLKQGNAGKWDCLSEIYDTPVDHPRRISVPWRPVEEGPTVDGLSVDGLSVDGSSVDGQPGNIFNHDLSTIDSNQLTPPPKPALELEPEPENQGQVVGGGGENLIPFPGQKNLKPGIEDEYLHLALKYGQIDYPEQFCNSKRKKWGENGGLSERDLRQLKHWRGIEAGERGIDMQNCSNDTAALMGLALAFHEPSGQGGRDDG